VNHDFEDGGALRTAVEQEPARRRRQPLVTPAQVVDVAYGLVVADGPDGLSMRKLAGALHVSLPTVYTAIRSREHLVAQLQTRLVEDLAGRLDADGALTGPAGGDRVELLAGAFLAWARSNPNLAAFLVAEPFSAEVAARLARAGTAEPSATPGTATPAALGRLVGLVADLHRAGELPRLDPLVAITFAVVQVQAVLALMREPGLAQLGEAAWRRLAAATLRSGLQTLGG
jgi:AcrR family transcriptional regulator